MAKRITREEFVELLKNRRTPTFISAIVATTPKFPKKAGLPVVHKIARISANMNRSYQTAATKVAGKKVDVQPRKWGKHVTASLIEHKGKYYVQFVAPEFKNTLFLVNGKPADEETLKKIKEFSRKQDSDVPVATYTVDNISEIHAFGETYILV